MWSPCPAQLSQALANSSRHVQSKQPGPDILEKAYHRFKQNFDGVNGGFGGAPKFPSTMLLEFFLRYYHRKGDGEALAMVEKTLQKMAAGGIYDQLGGGFHRYATDSAWLVPHFEKMLYDNALLAKSYLDAYAVTGKAEYRRVLEETLDYVVREMTSAEGGFYSSQDADSQGEEGKFYTWEEREIRDILGQPAADMICRHYGVSAGGNFEGRNILHLAQPAQVEALSTIAEARRLLFQSRESRIKPQRDEKVLTSWNGLMLGSMAQAAAALGRRDYLRVALDNASFLERKMMQDGELWHVYKDGQARVHGQLQDYSFAISGLMALHAASLDLHWLQMALRLADGMIQRFWDGEEARFYDIALTHNDLFMRPFQVYDEALPSGAGVATLALLKLARITGQTAWGEIAGKALSQVVPLIDQNPSGFPGWLNVLDFYFASPLEIAIVGRPHDRNMAQIGKTIGEVYLPNKVVVASMSADAGDSDNIALLQNRPRLENGATVYLCQNNTCRSPVTDPEQIAELLKQHTQH